MRDKVVRTPTRSCRVCRAQDSKKNLERWVFAEEGLVLDRRQSLPGRGYYTCSRVCANKIHQFIKRGRN